MSPEPLAVHEAFESAQTHVTPVRCPGNASETEAPETAAVLSSDPGTNVMFGIMMVDDDVDRPALRARVASVGGLVRLER